jgi:hypothetical protein
MKNDTAEIEGQFRAIFLPLPLFEKREQRTADHEMPLVMMWRWTDMGYQFNSYL